MATLLRILIAIGCLLVGAVVGALNTGPVRLDFMFFSVATTLGVAVLVALLLGALVAGVLLMLGSVLPLRMRLRRAESVARDAASAVVATPAPVRQSVVVPAPVVVSAPVPVTPATSATSAPRPAFEDDRGPA